MPGMFVAVPHRVDHLHLLRGEQLLSASHPASRPRRRQSSHRALSNKLLLKLRQCRKEVEDESSSGGTGVKLLLERDEVDAALIQPVHDLEQVADRAAQPVQPPHDKCVSLMEAFQALLQFRPVPRPAADRLLIDPLASSFPKIGQLSLGPLLFC